MIVFTDGYIADVWGPYPGNKNDATIMNEMLDKDIWGHFETDDVLIVDCGFRDSIDKIEEKDFIAKIPSFGDNPNRPLTTE